MGIPYSRSDFGVTLRQAQGGDAATERLTERSRRSLVEVQSNADAHGGSLLPIPYLLIPKT